MSSGPTRRHFLRTAATTGATLRLGEWATLRPLSPATADEAKVMPDLVRFGPDLDPVVRFIIDTPREKCPAMMIEQLREGLPYRNFLAALLLVNVGRGMDHSLVVLHSTKQLTLDAPVQERLLPTFWALGHGLVGDPKGSPIEGQTYAANRERAQQAVGKLPADWAQDGCSQGLTLDLLALIRGMEEEQACELAVSQLLGIPQSVDDT
jgi:hypothetical protein